MTDLLCCPILSSFCAAMPNSLSFSPTTTHHKAPFHTHAHTSSSCPLRCELMRATEAVTSVVYCLVGLVVVLQLFQQGLCNPCSLAARQAVIRHRLKCACVFVRLFVATYRPSFFKMRVHALQIVGVRASAAEFSSLAHSGFSAGAWRSSSTTSLPPHTHPRILHCSSRQVNNSGWHVTKNFVLQKVLHGRWAPPVVVESIPQQ